MAAERPYLNYGQIPDIPPGFNVQEVRVAGNRGTCGGVEMSLAAVKQVMEVVPPEIDVWTTNTPVNFPPAFEQYGERLKVADGDVTKIPDGSILIVSAHGAPPSLYEDARQKDLFVIDVTCSIVQDEQEKVREAAEAGIPIVYLGEESHPETIGIKGQVPQGVKIQVFDPNVSIPEDAQIPNGAKLFVKTTNNPDRNIERANELRERAEIDITRVLPCYALRNRYAAGKALTGVDFWMVVGDKTSNNARGLRDLAIEKKIPSALIRKPEEIDWEVFTPAIRKIGLTAAASTPEEFTQRVLDQFRQLGIPVVELAQEVPEAYRMFKLPKEKLEALQQRYANN